MLDPVNMEAPVIALSGFGDDFVTAPTDIIGTVTDDNLSDYTLSVAPIDTEVFTPISTGTEPVEDGVLGQFDPTLLDNGSYLVRLQAQDTGGNIVRTETRVDVSGDLKLGNFQLSFTDLEIPVSGIPITVTRTYDSLRANQQDEMGFGWRLEFRDTDLRNSLGRDELFEELGVRSNAFDARTRVYITPPGGRRQAFTFDPEPRFNLGRLPGEEKDTQLFLPRFRGDRGVTSTLSVAEIYIIQGADDRFYGLNSGEYDPANVDYGFGGYYELTTKEGIVYRIDAVTGDLLTVTDTNGNVLTYSDQGVESSTGKKVTFERDNQGRIQALTDPMGFVIEYDYDDAGDLIAVTDQEQNQTDFLYEEPERPHYLTQIIDPLDRPLSRTEYDEQGRLVKLLNASDEQVELVYDPGNSLQTVKDGLGNPTTYEYDSRGNIVRQVDALSHQTFAEYDDENNLTRLEDPNGLISQFTYDGNNNLLSKTAPADSRVAQADLDITYYSYDRRNNLTGLTLSTGASLGLRYDNQNNLVEMQDGLGSLIQVFTYNLRGDITLEGDAFGASTYEVDDFGNVIESTDLLGIVSTMTYDDNNRLETMTEEGVTSTFTYDDLGRELRADYGNGIFVDYGYEGDQGDWTSLDAPTIGHLERRFTDDGKLGGWTLVNGTTLNFDYDEAGRWRQQIDPSGRITENEYDPAGRLIETRDLASGNITQRDYDDGGRLITETDGLNQTTSYTYDGKGRVETITNARDKVTRYSYTDTSVTITDPLGRQTTTVNSDYYVPGRSQYPDGTEEISRYLFSNNLQEADEYPTKLIDRGGRDRDYSYDSVGRLKTATDLGSSLYRYDYVNEGLSQINSPLGETRKYAYEDELENLTRITYGDGTERQMAYGADNRLKTVTLPSGDTIEYQYNSAGQEISRTATKGGTVTTTYTLDGNVDTMTDPTGVTQYHYDPAGRLSGIDYPSGQRIRYTHDVLGQVRTVFTQARETAPMSTTEYDYDEVGNLKTVKDPLGGITTMTYDDGNRLEERLLPNGLKSIYTYDDLDQVRSIVHENSEGEVLVSVAYERNPGGEPNRITREDGSYVELGYDDALRLERETYYDAMGILEEEIVYGYDADGKRITKQKGGDTLTYRYDPGYQLVEVAGGSEPESYSFDQDGRVEEIVREGSTLTLDHDTYDRLIQANGTSYQYDGMNRRVRSTGPVERNFLVAPAMGSGLESIHQVVDGSSESAADYVYAGMMPLLSQGSDDIIYYLEDAMGSVIGLIDGSGKGISDLHYDGFGNLLDRARIEIPSVIGGDFRFHGQWVENNTKLYFLRARDYDSIHGRLLSRDSVKVSLQLPEDTNPYQFAYGNPLVFIDPSGRITLNLIGAAQLIQNKQYAIQTYLQNQAKEFLKDTITEAITNQLWRAFESFIPVTPLTEEILALARSAPQEAGNKFEAELRDKLCEFFKDVPDNFINKLYLGPSVSNSLGDVYKSGFNCPVEPERDKNYYATAFSNPDFIISPVNPIENRRKTTWLIGDVKLSILTINDDYFRANARKPGQFNAIVNHARKYGINIAGFLTLRRGKGSKDVLRNIEAKIIGEGIEDGVIVYVLSVFD